MEKNEFKKIVKQELKKHGFSFKGNEGFRLHKDNYLIGISIEHCSFEYAYRIYYGVVYLPDDDKFPPFKGFYDWYDDFSFTKDTFDSIYNYRIYPVCEDDNLIDRYCYIDNNIENLVQQLKVNIENKLSALNDYYFALRYYEKDLDYLSGLPIKTIKKLCAIYDFDKNYIETYRMKRRYKDAKID